MSDNNIHESSTSTNLEKNETPTVTFKTNIEQTNEKDVIKEIEESDSSDQGNSPGKSGLKSNNISKVPNKFIANWKHACDKTKDRTKELLKKWRTLPEIERERIGSLQGKCSFQVTSDPEKCGWSVHVWSTWVNRYSEERGMSLECEDPVSAPISEYQQKKFGHFFTQILDNDRDGLISGSDIEHFFEKLRHFADWSWNSMECNILQEVQKEFISTFFLKTDSQRSDFVAVPFSENSPSLSWKDMISIDDWFYKWQDLVNNAKALTDFSLWIQYFCKILFNAINRSESGSISQSELKNFYISVLGLDLASVLNVEDKAYKSMTSNGDSKLNYQLYKLCFSNFLLGKYSNGPGQWIFGPGVHTASSGQFPIDYSALNAESGELDQYTPLRQSYRRSVVV